MRRLSLVSVLVLLVLTACASDGGDEAALSSGVRGQVLLGPTCPVVQKGSPCPDEPLEGVEVRALAGDGDIAETTSGEDGRFELELPPGRYTLEAVVRPDGPGMFAKPVAVTVTAGAFVEVVVPVDSGIR
ncbi:MAG TPA: prealbumin-like fold domain-containing protein [Actinomycetota bacterium]|jgi:hypothetical protein|nr:prealbumin-like fold domain-containing protein [Actinomycetota bacterium]